MKELRITSISGVVAALSSGLALTAIAFLENKNEKTEGILKMLFEFPAGIAFNSIFSFALSIPFLAALVFPLVYLYRSHPQLWVYPIVPAAGTLLAYLIFYALANSQYHLSPTIAWIATMQAGLALGVAYAQIKLSSNKSG